MVEFNNLLRKKKKDTTETLFDEAEECLETSKSEVGPILIAGAEVTIEAPNEESPLKLAQAEAPAQGIINNPIPESPSNENNPAVSDGAESTPENLVESISSFKSVQDELKEKRKIVAELREQMKAGTLPKEETAQKILSLKEEISKILSAEKEREENIKQENIKKRAAAKEKRESEAEKNTP